MTPVTFCAAREAACVCHEPTGHEGPHKCGLDACRVEWVYDGERFVPVRFPGGQDVSLQGVMEVLQGLLDG